MCALVAINISLLWSEDQFHRCTCKFNPPMTNGESSLDPNNLRLLLPVVADRFNRTTQQRFFTGRAFFLG